MTTANSLAVMVAALLSAMTFQVQAAGASYAALVSAKPLFPSPLEWLGTREPADAESAALLGAIGDFETNGVTVGFTSLEEFLDAHPESAWAPSLHVNMAEYYRLHGRYTLALTHWEKAWDATKGSQQLAAQKIAVRAVAGWTSLLASLGRKRKAQSILKELDGLHLALGVYGTSIEETREGLAVMNARPADSYRCGSFALGQVAKALHLDVNLSRRLFATESPDGGFHISQLLALAETNGMAMEAVRRPVGGEIVVPSVIHWKLNHYAAIVEKQGDRYRVMDPTFGGQVWMDAATIEAEASGAFLVPAGQVPAGWTKLSEAECATIYGKGYPNEFYDWDDDGPSDCDSGDDQDAHCDPPAANDGPSTDGSTNSCCSGMPVWWVSEPYTTLWLVDTPLLYHLSDGKWMRLELRYKHRGEDRGSQIGGFGDKWECNLLEMLSSDGTSGYYSNHLAGGGIRPLTEGIRDYKSGSLFNSCTRYLGLGIILPVCAADWVTVLGSQSVYTNTFVFSSGITNYFLTHRIDQYGRTTMFNYQHIGNMVRLTNVVDRDGRPFNLVYGNSTFTNLITVATDPYGRSAHFYYDSQGRLTNIVDALGMSSTFQYDSSDDITNMTTPYGQTSFQYYENTDPSDQNAMNRGLLITEPSGDHQLYTYRDHITSADTIAYYRVSYHWNRAQYHAISDQGKTNVLDMPDEDYTKAETKAWDHGDPDGSMETVDDTLLGRAGPLDPALGTRSGLVTFQYQGTLKRITQADRAYSGVTISRNSLGRPEVITYSGTGGTATYSNVFDSSGVNLQNVSGPRGEATRHYGYNPGITNLLTSVTNALNEVIRYTHDTNTMKVTSITFPGGLVRSNIYCPGGASKGFPQAQIDDGIRTNCFGYTDGNLTSETNELGLVTGYQYDNLNRLVCTTYPDQTTVSNWYDKLDLAGVKDRLNRWTYYGYNAVRQLTDVTNADGQVTHYDYCSCGSPSAITRWNGTSALTTYYYYDLAGRLTNVVYPDGYQLDYYYNIDDLLTNVSDSAGHQLELSYKSLGLRFELDSADLYDAWGNGKILLQRSFDEYGRVTDSQDRNGVDTTFGYDDLGRVTGRTNWGSTMFAAEQFVYDANGLTNYTDPLGHVTTFVRDGAGRVLYETNANNEVLQFTYNPADELLTLTDGNGHTTHWNYDQYGRVTNKVDAAGNTLFVYQYDVLDRLTNRWSIAKGNTAYAYDPLGNLTNVAYPTSGTIAYRYDSLNRLTNVLDSLGSTVFTWTDGNQLASEDGPWADDTVSYTYDNRLRSGLSLAQPNASPWVQSYAYDDYMRLTNVISAAGSFGYDYWNGSFASDRVQDLYLPASGAYILNDHDDLARLTDTTLYASGGLDQHSYVYDQASQRTQQVFSAYNYVNYTYDNIGQLKTAQGYEADGTPRLHEQFGYAYDKGWNLNWRTNNALIQAFNVNSLNELTNATRSGALTVAGSTTIAATDVTVNGQEAERYGDATFARTNLALADGNNTFTAIATDSLGRWDTNSVSVNLPATNTFVYDLNGNLRTNNSRIYDYDDENELIAVTEPNAWREEFSYDGLMRRRIRKDYTWSSAIGGWSLTNEVRYVYDAWLVIQERDGDNLPLVTYTRGNDQSGSLEEAGGIGGLLARTDNSQLLVGSPSAHAYYHCDGNGNVTALVDSNGMVVARYSYDPYGNMLAMSGPLAQANTYRFSSKEWEGNSGLYYYGFRFYSPSLQRWPNRDPIQEHGGINLFFFVRNLPVGGMDSYGFCDDDDPDIEKGLAELFFPEDEYVEYANPPGGTFIGAAPAPNTCPMTEADWEKEIRQFVEELFEQVHPLDPDSPVYRHPDTLGECGGLDKDHRYSQTAFPEQKDRPENIDPKPAVENRGPKARWEKDLIGFQSQLKAAGFTQAQIQGITQSEWDDIANSVHATCHANMDLTISVQY